MSGAFVFLDDETTRNARRAVPASASSRAMKPWLTIGATVVLGAMTLLLRHESFAHNHAADQYEDLYYIPGPDELRTLSLGHHAALADLLFARACVYLGESFAQHADGQHIFEYVETILAIDPDFEAAYRWAPVFTLYRPTAVTVDEIQHAVAILRRGTERFPESGRLAWTTGATLTFELAPRLAVDDPARDAARAEGARYLMRAVTLGGAPAWAALSSSSILAQVGELETAASQLETVYALVDDENMRARILERISDVRSASRSRAIESEVNRFELERGRRMPYTTPELYLLMWDPLDATLDLGARAPFGELANRDLIDIE